MAGWTVPGYTETRALGTGEAGRIVEAFHDPTGVRVAITYPDATLCSNPAFRARFGSDAERLTGLDHPNVVRVRALVETANDMALITEAVSGATLRRVLAASGPLSPEAALAVLRGSLLGIGAADEVGVAHRDYQPSNVVVTPEGSCKVGGFGLAARTAAMMPAAGSPSYLAPELWEGASPRLATDLYALTATFYECLTGRVPFTADSVFELQTMHRAAPVPMDSVPTALAPLVAQGLAKAPAERPVSAAAFLAELEAAAVVEFGLEWEERGRQELAALVAAVPADGAGAETAAAAVGAAAGVGAGAAAAADEAATSVLPVVRDADTTVLPAVPADAAREATTSVLPAVSTGVAAPAAWKAAPAAVVSPAVAAAAAAAAREAAFAPDLPADDGEGMGRGTKVSIAAAAVAVVGAVVAAVAFSPGKHAAAADGSTSSLVTTPSGQSSSGDDGASPGIAGAAPTSGSSRADGGSSPATTGGPTTAPTDGAASGTSPGATGTQIGLPLPTAGSWTAPSYSFPLSSSGPSTWGGSSAPTSASSTAVTVSASAEMTQSTYSGPCPPTDPPTGTVTFTVSGLSAGDTELITYHWHVVGGGGATSGGGGGSGSGQVEASDGSTTRGFTVTPDQHTQKLSGTVEITWSAPGTAGGTTDAGSVDITCTPSGGSSSGGGVPSSTGW